MPTRQPTAWSRCRPTWKPSFAPSSGATGNLGAGFMTARRSPICWSIWSRAPTGRTASCARRSCDRRGDEHHLAPFSRRSARREDDARRAADPYPDAGRCEPAIAADAVTHDRAAVLVGDVEEALVGIEGEEARRAAMGRHPLARRQRALAAVDAEHADAVVAAIGHVDIAAGAIDRDLRARAVAGELRRGGRDRLQRRERAASPILAGGGDRRIGLVDDVGPRLGGVEIDMAWGGTRPRRHARGLDQDLVPCVEAIGDDGVGALARHVEEAALGVERNVVHAHGALLGAMRAERAGHGGEGAIGQQAAVVRQREDGERIGAVVAHRKEAAGRIEGKMDRIVAAGRLAVERRQLAGAWIYGERVDLAAIAMNRVEACAVGIDGEERRVLEAAEALQVGEGAGAAVDAIDVDAVAVAVPLRRRVAADIG